MEGKLPIVIKQRGEDDVVRSGVAMAVNRPVP
jgi:hypothetical protein